MRCCCFSCFLAMLCILRSPFGVTKKKEGAPLGIYCFCPERSASSSAIYYVIVAPKGQEHSGKQRALYSEGALYYVPLAGAKRPPKGRKQTKKPFAPSGAAIYAQRALAVKGTLFPAVLLPLRGNDDVIYSRLCASFSSSALVRPLRGRRALWAYIVVPLRAALRLYIARRIVVGFGPSPLGTERTKGERSSSPSVRLCVPLSGRRRQRANTLFSPASGTQSRRPRYICPKGPRRGESQRAAFRQLCL